MSAFMGFGGYDPLNYVYHTSRSPYGVQPTSAPYSANHQLNYSSPGTAVGYDIARNDGGYPGQKEVCWNGQSPSVVDPHYPYVQLALAEKANALKIADTSATSETHTKAHREKYMYDHTAMNGTASADSVDQGNSSFSPSKSYKYDQQSEVKPNTDIQLHTGEQVYNERLNSAQLAGHFVCSTGNVADINSTTRQSTYSTLEMKSPSFTLNSEENSQYKQISPSTSDTQQSQQQPFVFLKEANENLAKSPNSTNSVGVRHSTETAVYTTIRGGEYGGSTGDLTGTNSQYGISNNSATDVQVSRPFENNSLSTYYHGNKNRLQNDGSGTMTSVDIQRTVEGDILSPDKGVDRTSVNALSSVVGLANRTSPSTYGVTPIPGKKIILYTYS